MEFLEEGLLRTLCFFDVCDYAPTEIELFIHLDVGQPTYVQPGLIQAREVLERLIRSRSIQVLRGRCHLPERSSLVEEHEKREKFFPRKLRRARSVVRWLRRIDGIRFVALCNTTAYAHARDEGDLDFFVVMKAGHLWQGRLWSTLPYKLLGQRPGINGVRDAVCLSFFIDDQALDLSNLQLPENDVYFRHWFLSLLPLYDDGVSVELWKANALVHRRHPLGRQWILNRDVSISPATVRIPTFSFLESSARKFQQRAFSPPIRALVNKDTRVVATDHVLKFHVEDGRAAIRDAYQDRCKQYGVQP